MKKLISIIIGLLILGLVPITNAAPIDATISGIDLTITYTEPTLNVGGSPLLDLDKTTIYINPSNAPIFTREVAASSPTGGGNIIQVITVIVNEGEEIDVEVWATASDRSSNESASSPIKFKRIDRLAPAAIK